MRHPLIWCSPRFTMTSHLNYHRHYIGLIVLHFVCRQKNNTISKLWRFKWYQIMYCIFSFIITNLLFTITGICAGQVAISYWVTKNRKLRDRTADFMEVQTQCVIIIMCVTWIFVFVALIKFTLPKKRYTTLWQMWWLKMQFLRSFSIKWNRVFEHRYKKWQCSFCSF